MNRNNRFSILTILFFLNVFMLLAQNNQEKQEPLFKILKILESRYKVSFSYIDDNIKNKQAFLPSPDISLDEALEFLKIDTQLGFEKIDDRFVVIKKISLPKKGQFNTQRLEEVVITNYLTQGITKFNDGSISLKPETFGILPGLIEPDVLQIIQALPGVMSTDETVSNINVRGGTHDQNLILWDGIKMYQSGHFFGLISAFNPYTTKHINIYKNGTHAKYGDGISSVIDMRLSNVIDNDFQAGLGFNLINADGYTKIPLSKKAELQLSARRSVTDLILTPTYNQYFKRVFQDSELSNTEKNTNSISKNESFYFYDVSLKFLYDISKKDKFRLNLLNGKNNLHYDEVSTINNENEALNSRLTQENQAVSISYTRDWNQDLSTSAQIYVSNYDLDATNQDILNDQRLIQENEVYDGAIKLDIDYNFNSQLTFNAGYQFSEIGISNLADVNNPVYRSYIKEVIRSHAIYAETNLLSYNANTNLKLGGRFNYFQKFNMFLAEPRLSFSQRFLNYFRFEILGEFKSQTTSQIIDLQNDFLGIEKRRWVLANNDNRPITKSKQLSVGIHFNKNQLLFSAETYIKKVNGITTRSQGFQNQYQFTNAIGSYEIKGLDILLNKQFDDIVSAWVSYSYSTNNYTFKTLNNGTPFPNNTDIRHAVTFAGTYTYNKLKLALGFNWHSGKPTTEPLDYDNTNRDDITYKSPNSSTLKDYLRADCSATYGFDLSRNSRATIGASVWNILNKKNIINTYYTLDNNNSINKVENLSLGITPNISFRLFF